MELRVFAGYKQIGACKCSYTDCYHSHIQEELTFKTQLHQSELNETRTRMEFTMDEVDSRTQKEVEHRLQEALADLRRQHEQQTQIYREEMESLYESKVCACALSRYTNNLIVLSVSTI